MSRTIELPEARVKSHKSVHFEDHEDYLNQELERKEIIPSVVGLEDDLVVGGAQVSIDFDELSNQLE